MRKLMIGITVGVLVGAIASVLLAGPLGAALAMAGPDDSGTGFLSNIQRIYRNALVSPLTRVEQEIEDEEIASFYHDLLEECGLTPDAETQVDPLSQ
jgi:hypothetical protein